MTRTNRALAAATALAAGVLAVGVAPAQAASRVIIVPTDFVPATTTPGQYGSDTRLLGGYTVEGTALHLTTRPDPVSGAATSQSKVAEYVQAPDGTLLSSATDTALAYTPISGAAPGAQLVVDMDNDGDQDGILVGESIYGGNWWASNPLAAYVGRNPGAATVPPGNGYQHSAPLTTWATAYPDAVVSSFGFSLGSGVLGDGVLSSITFAGDSYTFAEPAAQVVLTSKDQCKNGGWATSTTPAYKNQGDCVSDLATRR